MKPLKILFIEDQERYARVVLEQLRCWKDQPCEVLLHYQYDTAASLLNGKGEDFDVVLIGFQGEEDIPMARKVLKHVGDDAIVMFLLKNNNKKCIAAVRSLGTSHFLIKRDVQARILPRVLQYEMEVARLHEHSGDEKATGAQLKKVSQMVKALAKDVRNPSSIVRLALASLSGASKDNGDLSQYLELLGDDISQTKSIIKELWTKREGRRPFLSGDHKVKPAHQRAV